MRSIQWRAAVLAAACSLPGCDPGRAPDFGGISGINEISLFPTARSCTEEPAGWLIFSPFSTEIEVGSSIDLELLPIAPSGYNCARLIASVEWVATVPGIVSLRPGANVDEATLTGEAPGKTHIVATITLSSDRVMTAGRPNNDVVVVVPATTAE